MKQSKQKICRPLRFVRGITICASSRPISAAIFFPHSYVKAGPVLLVYMEVDTVSINYTSVFVLYAVGDFLTAICGGWIPYLSCQYEALYVFNNRLAFCIANFCLSKISSNIVSLFLQYLWFMCSLKRSL